MSSWELFEGLLLALTDAEHDFKENACRGFGQFQCLVRQLYDSDFDCNSLLFASQAPAVFVAVLTSITAEQSSYWFLHLFPEIRILREGLHMV